MDAMKAMKAMKAVTMKKWPAFEGASRLRRSVPPPKGIPKASRCNDCDNCNNCVDVTIVMIVMNVNILTRATSIVTIPTIAKVVTSVAAELDATIVDVVNCDQFDDDCEGGLQ